MITKVKAKSPMTNLKEIEKGDLFSEKSYYVFSHEENGKRFFTNPLAPDVKPFAIGNAYIEKFFYPADQYNEVITVGMKDKIWTQGQIDKEVKNNNIAPNDYKPGDLKLRGIRTIWDSIGDQCFIVEFFKADKPKTKKALKAEKEAQAIAAMDVVLKAKKSKKSMEIAIREQLEWVQANPISDTIKGELRQLKGWKLQHTSNDGKYKVYDSVNQGERYVNINTIQSLIVAGKRYNVK